MYLAICIESYEAIMSHSHSSTDWDARYREKDRLWSGDPNEALVQYASDLTPGTALDVGCGEGADALWLAENGWQVTGIDLSSVAISRAKESATVRNLDVEFQVRDVATVVEDAPSAFDLVTAFFIHSRDDEERAETLRATAKLVKPGGRVLLVSHAATPPWAQHRHEDGSGAPKFEKTTKSEIAALGIADWHIEIAQEYERPVTGPDGEQTTMRDAIVRAHRPSS